MENPRKDSRKQQALVDLHRLTRVVLSNLEEGSKNRLMDPKELRMLGGTAIRALRLYLKALDEDSEPRRRKARWILRREQRTIAEDQAVAGNE